MPNFPQLIVNFILVSTVHGLISKKINKLIGKLEDVKALPQTVCLTISTSGNVILSFSHTDHKNLFILCNFDHLNSQIQKLCPAKGISHGYIQKQSLLLFFSFLFKRYDQIDLSLNIAFNHLYCWPPTESMTCYSHM